MQQYVMEVMIFCSFLFQDSTEMEEIEEEEEEEEEEDAPVLMICEATHTYKGQYEDELSFTAGDQVYITTDSELG